MTGAGELLDSDNKMNEVAEALMMEPTRYPVLTGVPYVLIEEKKSWDSVYGSALGSGRVQGRVVSLYLGVCLCGGKL